LEVRNPNSPPFPQAAGELFSAASGSKDLTDAFPPVGVSSYSDYSLDKLIIYFLNDM
jgi:hypothetical protein